MLDKLNRKQKRIGKSHIDFEQNVEKDRGVNYTHLMIKLFPNIRQITYRFRANGARIPVTSFKYLDYIHFINIFFNFYIGPTVKLYFDNVF